jgi:hypothetical protein
MRMEATSIAGIERQRARSMASMNSATEAQRRSGPLDRHVLAVWLVRGDH